MTKKNSLSKKTPAKAIKAAKPVAKKQATPVKSKSQKISKPVSAKTKTPKTPQKISPVKKVAPKKVASKVVSKKAPPAKTKISIAKKASPKVTVKKIIQPAPKKAPLKTNTKKTLIASAITRGALQQTFVSKPPTKKNQQLSPFFSKQRQRLLTLKDMLLDSISGVARGNLRSGSDSSAFGEHQADAGSDAYDRDFALGILSQEQNSLYEIDEALKRIDDGTYGVCEISNKQIPRARLEARPFTRYTVECQAELEKRQHVSGVRVPVSALFGITEEENEQEEDEGFNDNLKE